MAVRIFNPIEVYINQERPFAYESGILDCIFVRLDVSREEATEEQRKETEKTSGNRLMKDMKI